jgi:hypothetical protein
MATTMAPGFGAYTSLSDPGAGTTCPDAELGAGATEPPTLGAEEAAGTDGDGVVPHAASRQTTSQTDDRART